MRIKLNIPENSISTEYQYTHDILQEGKLFPTLTIGRDSYIEEAFVDTVPDQQLLYNLQIGRYCAIAHNVRFIINLNHDYKRVCQGRIRNIPYHRPELTCRKGEILIMNDCWIGAGATILSGVTIGNGAVVAAESVVAKNVPPYAIVAGNPARIIGYRFEPDEIESLNLIRWWNWPDDMIEQHSLELQGDIHSFIQNNLSFVRDSLSHIVPADIQSVPKCNQGEEKIFLYIPDFEQDYPTYPQVIDAFARSYSDTNCELLLYIKDTNPEKKLEILDEIFSRYDDVNCYINLYIGVLADDRELFCQADYYITNRSEKNILYVDTADYFNIPIISAFNRPIFNRNNHIETMVKSDILTTDTRIQNLERKTDIVVHSQELIKDAIHQLSINQVAMDHAFENIKYEIIPKKLIYPKIEPIDATIRKIIDEHCSLCRFGDGEFSIMAGKSRQKFQCTDPTLSNRLQAVLHSQHKKILIAIPDMYGDLSKYNIDGKYNIRKYLTNTVRSQHYALLDMTRTYSNSHLTRPYAMFADNRSDAPHRRFDQLRKIWDQRKLLIIEGEHTRMGIGNDLFSNAIDIQRILGPAEHAFNRYDDLLNTALQQDKTRLILIALGPTATVLAYDLAIAGFQALDIGHIDLEYEWMLANTGGKVLIRGKYNNEIPGGDHVTIIHDTTYEQQIIAKLY